MIVTSLSSMPRLYREEQREAERKVYKELINQLEDIYLQTFEKITDIGFGDGTLTKITQLLLLSRDAAISPLHSEMEKNNEQNRNNNAIKS